MNQETMLKKVRTRFAPSPTGFLHLGGARTALFSWAFARHHQGTFVLRIEDTDVERSKPEAVQAIIDGMKWLGLDHDEGPFFQMQRVDRYKEVIQKMIQDGTAYLCYSTPEEVEEMRQRFKVAGEKPRYDGTWRPETGKVLPDIPADRTPVVRFKNPLDGAVSWNDIVKGTITISNAELDDLVIARQDGTPTYNFCVAVDDSDMDITHVIRGDDHVNNTPRQINILRAIGAEVPEYGHLPMILGPDGEKLSKRHGAVSVMEYPAKGYLQPAMLNYLARLGWSHGDDEIFTIDQFCQWFDLTHMTKAPAKFDFDKLNWLNNHYIKDMDNYALAEQVVVRLASTGIDFDTHSPNSIKVMELLKDRANTLEDLTEAAKMFYAPQNPDPALLALHVTADVTLALSHFASECELIEWNKDAIAALIKKVITEHNLKMPQIAMPLRVIVAGQVHTPAINEVLMLFGRTEVINRIHNCI